MQEDLPRNSEAGAARLRPHSSSQFLLECDIDGNVLWMNEAARVRLGRTEELLAGLEEEQSAALRQYLRECRPGDELTLATLPSRPGVPLRLSCLMRGAHRVVLAAEVRERAADRLETAGAGLISLESRLLQRYFRLLRAQQVLDSRHQRGRRSAGLALMEQLERERARLGRELHTGAGQAYSAIRYQLEWIEKRAPELPPEIRKCLEQIGRAARAADAEVRAVSKRLHPPDWQALGLVDALRNLWHNSGIPETFLGTLALGPLEAEPPHPVRVAIYRIAQEGLSNVIRHSGATQLALTLEQNDGWLRLRLEDNGRGFEIQGAAGTQGIGLRSIRDQVQALGGELELQSGSGGTKLEVRIPVEPSDE